MTVLSREAGPSDLRVRLRDGRGKGRGSHKPCNCENYWQDPASQGHSAFLSALA